MKALLLGLLLVTVGTGLSLGEQADGSFNGSVAISGPVDLDVRTDAGGISVKAGSPGSLHIHAILKAQHSWLDFDNVTTRIRELEHNPPVEQNGNRVLVGYVHDRDLLKGISVRFEIETPSDTRLRARADSGGVEISGIHGLVDCKTDSGGIEIENVGSDVHAEADSGGIHINHVKGAVFARVDSGGIDATEIGGALDVQSDSGHMRLSQTIASPIHAKADSGGISVTLVPGAGYDISAEVGSGRISVPEMTMSSAFSRHHIEGRIRGGGPPISIRAHSGGITIN